MLEFPHDPGAPPPEARRVCRTRTSEACMTARFRKTARTSRISLLIAVLTIPLVSCEASTLIIGAEVSSYIARVSVNNIVAELVQSSPPIPSTGPTVSVPANAETITGGSYQEDFVGSGDFQSVAIFVDGVDGYYLATLPAATSFGRSLITIGSLPPDLDFNLGYMVAGADGVWGGASFTAVHAIQVAGGDIQVSVTWNTDADVDLHVVDPLGQEVYYGNRMTAQGGELDIDANAACSTSTLFQENIGWQPGTAPSGEYIVRLDYWSACSAASTDYTVTVNVRPGQPGGTVLTFSGTFTGTGTGGGAGDGILITTFRF